MGEQQFQNGLTLGSFQFIDPRGGTLVDEQRLAAADRVRTNDWVRQRRVLPAGLLPAREVFSGVAKPLQGPCVLDSPKSPQQKALFR